MMPHRLLGGKGRAVRDGVDASMPLLGDLRNDCSDCRVRKSGKEKIMLDRSGEAS